MYLFLLHDSPVPHVHNFALDAWLTAVNAGVSLLAVALMGYLSLRWVRCRAANQPPRNQAHS